MEEVYKELMMIKDKFIEAGLNEKMYFHMGDRTLNSEAYDPLRPCVDGKRSTEEVYKELMIIKDKFIKVGLNERNIVIRGDRTLNSECCDPVATSRPEILVQQHH
ncbi:Uncharacterized protein Adt_21436 [Abeliophyllum distichum]|uniref:Uncharacterized protein n=1 Tax=Abeliophyllum distichum TaxID=126358 RepID=A0ABD1SZB8_9LAMI